MTVVIKSEQVQRYLIEIRQDKFSQGYTVSACRMQDEFRAGYPEDTRYYSTLQRAERRYRDLKNKVVNW